MVAYIVETWSIDEKNRLNPCNGIAINVLHDKVFENRLLTITPDFKIKILSILYKDKKKPNIEEFFLKYDNQDIILPSRFLSGAEFLNYHNTLRFKP